MIDGIFVFDLVAPALLAQDTVTSVSAPGTRADPAVLDRFRSLSRGDPPAQGG